MKIYTGQGDRGKTRIYSGERVLKSDLRVEAYGTIDELGAIIAFARSFAVQEETLEYLGRIQRELFMVAAELASSNPEEQLKDKITPEHIKELEENIDDITKKIELGNEFVIPGPYSSSASLHIARTVSRRAERAVVRHAQNTPVRNEILVYLNRISDLLFMLANYEEKEVRELP